MGPILSSDDAAYHHSTAPVFFAKQSMISKSRIKIGPDSQDDPCRQFGASYIFSTRGICSTPKNLLLHIPLLCSINEVTRIAANRIIALVANHSRPSSKGQKE